MVWLLKAKAIPIAIHTFHVEFCIFYFIGWGNSVAQCCEYFLIAFYYELLEDAVDFEVEAIFSIFENFKRTPTNTCSVNLKYDN